MEITLGEPELCNLGFRCIKCKERVTTNDGDVCGWCAEQIGMVGCVVWVKKKATGRPNKQRAQILAVAGTRPDNVIILVKMLGDGASIKIKYGDICGIELNPNITIRLKVKGVKVTTRSPSKSEG